MRRLPRFLHRWVGETFPRLTSERPDRSTDGVCNATDCRAIVPLQDTLHIDPLVGEGVISAQ